MSFRSLAWFLLPVLVFGGTAQATPCIVIAESKSASVAVESSNFELAGADGKRTALRLRKCEGMTVLAGRITVTVKHPVGDWRTLQLNTNEMLTPERIASLKPDQGKIGAVLDAMFHGDAYSKPGTSRSDESSGPDRTRFPEVEIRLRDNARADEILTLLLKVRGEIAGGPGQLGIYRIALPNGNVTEAVENLRASSIVESVDAPERKP